MAQHQGGANTAELILIQLCHDSFAVLADLNGHWPCRVVNRSRLREYNGVAETINDQPLWGGIGVNVGASLLNKRRFHGLCERLVGLAFSLRTLPSVKKLIIYAKIPRGRVRSSNSCLVATPEQCSAILHISAELGVVINVMIILGMQRHHV